MMKFKHGCDPDSMFKKNQLKMGITTELEHTDSRKIAKMIAKGHLAGENPRYYTLLKKAGL